MKARSLGYIGENLAEKYLRGRGYEILDKNFTVRGGEIDIVARKGGVLVFVEVKTRTSDFFGEGNESVDRLKKKRISYAIGKYLYLKISEPDPNFRLDIIEVEIDSKSGGLKNINHFEDIEV